MSHVLPTAPTRLRRQLPALLGGSLLILAVLLLTRTLMPAVIFAALLGLTLIARRVLRGQTRRYATLGFGTVAAISGVSLVLTVTGKLLLALTFALLCAAVVGAGVWAVRRHVVPRVNPAPAPLPEHTAEAWSAQVERGELTKTHFGKAGSSRT